MKVITNGESFLILGSCHVEPCSNNPEWVYVIFLGGKIHTKYKVCIGIEELLTFLTNDDKMIEAPFYESKL